MLRSAGNPKQLKTRVFEIAEAHGISQRWLAEQYGLTQVHISDIKNGKAAISRRFIERSCQIFSDYSFEQLFFVDDVKDVA